MTKPNELLPCPFKDSHRVRIYHDKFGYAGECCECGFRMPQVNTEQEAINRWNTRSHLQPTPDDALTKAIERLIKSWDKRIAECKERGECGRGSEFCDLRNELARKIKIKQLNYWDL